MRQFLTVSALVFIVTFTPACGIFLGNVKPVAEKSENYSVMDLSGAGKNWERIEAEEPAEPVSSGGPDVSDVSYQSRRTGSIISLNSACRESLKTRTEDLKDFTHQLLLGISDINDKSEEYVNLQGFRALRTTLRGYLQGEAVKLRTVVMKSDECLFDLMYIARPETFDEEASTFARFVDSLRLR